MENQHTDDLSRILRTVEEILEIVHFMKDHRSQLEGDPILDFAEVCQLLRQSERQVRRFREQGLLVGFNIGARRMYLLSEVQEFIRSEQLERLIKMNFLLSKSLLLFEYLCSQSDEPLFLTADAACEVLDIRPETLTRYRQKRLIRPKIYRRQFLYSAYDLLMLVYRINQRNLQNALRRTPRIVVGPDEQKV